MFPTLQSTIRCMCPQIISKSTRGKFDMGWDKLRELRINNLIKLGIVPADVKSNPFGGIPKWETLSEGTKSWVCP